MIAQRLVLLPIVIAAHIHDRFGARSIHRSRGMGGDFIPQVAAILEPTRIAGTIGACPGGALCQGTQRHGIAGFGAFLIPGTGIIPRLIAVGDVERIKEEIGAVVDITIGSQGVLFKRRIHMCHVHHGIIAGHQQCNLPAIGEHLQFKS